MKQKEHVLKLILESEEKNRMIHNALIRALEPGFRFGPHCHRNIELCLMQKGECDILINGEAVTVHAKEFLVLFPNVIHAFQVKTEKGCQFWQLHFNPESFLDFPESACRGQKFLYYISTESLWYLKQKFSPQLLSCIQRITYELNNDEMNHRAIANLYIYELVLLLSREISQTFESMLEPAHPAVLDAVRYIQEHMEKKLSLKEIAEACFISKRHLMNLFKRDMHVTVNDYINITKINYAMNNIYHHTSTELSESLGFSSVQYFSTIFKKYTGVTPKEYRMLHHPEEDEPFSGEKAVRC